jgi:hypothetical protein
MKLIQILALVAALAVAALAQNAGSTGSQKSAPPASSKANAGGKTAPNGAGGAQAPGVKLIVPKHPVHANAAGGKNSSPTNAGAVKTSAQAGPKSRATQKAPVMVMKPAPKQPAKSKLLATAPKKTDAKNPHGDEKSQVKMVQKGPNGAKAADQLPTIAMAANGRRDPFLSIIRSLPTSASGPNCSVGKRCLFIPELELKGIAKDTDGQMMAVVVSNTHRAYFLRENDQVFNGSVQKINGDSVVFREFATDHLGRETAHEVVKRIPKS